MVQQLISSIDLSFCTVNTLVIMSHQDGCWTKRRKRGESWEKHGSFDILTKYQTTPVKHDASGLIHAFCVIRRRVKTLIEIVTVFLILTLHRICLTASDHASNRHIFNFEHAIHTWCDSQEAWLSFTFLILQEKKIQAFNR